MLDPIIITGAARSGTSIVAGSIYLCGAYGGDMFGATQFNKKGFYENKYIRNSIIKPFLRMIDSDPKGQHPLPDINRVLEFSKDDKKVARFKEDVLIGMKSQKIPLNKIWFLKEPKVSLMWPLWRKAFPEAKWVIVRRNPDGIVASCLRTGFMRAHKTRAGWLGWVAEHEKRFEEIYDSGASVFEIWPTRAVNGDLTELQMVINNLGLKWNEKEIRQFITPSLWRGTPDPTGRS